MFIVLIQRRVFHSLYTEITHIPYTTIHCGYGLAYNCTDGGGGGLDNFSTVSVLQQEGRRNLINTGTVRKVAPTITASGMITGGTMKVIPEAVVGGGHFLHGCGCSFLH